MLLYLEEGIAPSNENGLSIEVVARVGFPKAGVFIVILVYLEERTAPSRVAHHNLMAASVAADGAVEVARRG